MTLTDTANRAGTDTADRADSTELEITPLSANIGAEIRGVDLREVDDVTIEAIRAQLVEHKVVFFPGQHLQPAEHVALAKRFGEPTRAHPILPVLADHPEVFEIDYTVARSLALGSNKPRYDAVSWHTDVTFVERPPLGSILNAVVIPPSGGDTLFSSQEAAYDALSDPIKALLEGLTATHDGTHQFGELLKVFRKDGDQDWEGEQYTELKPVSHPVVRTHPESGRKSLFVNPGFTQYINELAPKESEVLLQFLYAHAVRPEFTVRYHWTAGDLGFWDNRSTQHSVVGDFGDQHRVIQRVTIRGDAPV